MLSEFGHFLLRGQAYVRLAPLLDGQRSVDEIVDCLQGHVSAPMVYYAIELLRNKGYVVDATLSMPPAQAAFWDVLHGDPADIVRRLRNAMVTVVSYGNVDPVPFQTMLASLGVRVGDEGAYWVVLTDDYLQGGLDTFNREALTRSRSWMLVKPMGTELCIGPLFVPSKTGCWLCLASRLRGHRKIESYLQGRENSCEPFFTSLAALPSTLNTALNIAATETAKWIVRGTNERLAGRVVTLNALSLEQRDHVLVRRPQCAHCGDPHAFAARQRAPLVLQSRRKVFTTDGGHRSVSPEGTLKKLAHHISPITGIVSALRQGFAGEAERALAPRYISDYNLGDMEDDLSALRQGLRRRAWGKGKHVTQAKASALCESIERYSGIFQGDEARIRARYSDLRDAGLHPNACMLFSQQQFRTRQQWNIKGRRFNWVPEPFDDQAKIEWSPLWSLTYNARRYLPTAYCYYGYTRQYRVHFAPADSNGCAAGHNKEEAVLQGFMELVERDSVALWWYNRLKKPAVDLASFADPYVQALPAYYHQTLQRTLWVLDITSDLNIPAFAAISRRNDEAAGDMILGFGAHFDPRIALLRALTEVNQSLPFGFLATVDRDHTRLDKSGETAAIERQSYLLPDDTVAPKVLSDYSSLRSDDLYTDVMTAVRIAEGNGLETLVLDQSRPDTGLHVVKVVVPGLRHFWPRFAPGRLYDVPVHMGWLPAPLTEEQLNPQHIFL